MFTELVESRPKRERNKSGTIGSVLLHTSVAILLVVATAQGEYTRGRPPERVIPLRPPTVPAPQPPRRATDGPPNSVSTATPPPPAMPALPTIDPVGLPPIDPNATPVEPDEFRRAGTGTSTPGTSSTSGITGEAFASEYVERMAVSSSSNAPPRYPELLRASGLDGRVNLLFVVDTLGHVEPSSIETLASTNELFTRAARDALLRWHFSPAEVRSHKVRVRMQQPFVFTITR